MLLSVRELELRKIAFEKLFPVGSIDLEDTSFRQSETMCIDGVAELVGGTEEIRVRGHIKGRLEGECDRCLVVSPFPVDRDFELFYRPASMDGGPLESELDPSEIEVGFYEGEGVEVAAVLREQVALWLPMHWTCGEDCRGICPVCGVNLNRETCDCKREETDDRWAALRDFRPSKPS